MRILVTGGAGYIGSTAAAILLENGFEVTVLDDCSTGHAELVAPGAKFVKGSLLEKSDLVTALEGCEAVMHFGAKSLVGESVLKPEIYWNTNVNGTRILLEAMREKSIKKIVFSSTAATYGEPKRTPITEEDETKPTNPYGSSKLAVDYMLTSEAIAYGLAAISLRYFNVAGAYKSKSGWLTENHNPETHLIPNTLRATDTNPLKIFGNDWPTADGTCIRDYVHVTDLIEAHISALKNVEAGKHSIINLGSGGGYSVNEVVAAAAKAVRRAIPAKVTDRRPGDPAVLIADISKAEKVLGWKPTRNLEVMVQDAWESFQ
jgi:UDP-glucose 4-epimerase